MAENKQHDTRTASRPDCVTEIRMGNSVLVVSGYFKKDTTTTAADKMARVDKGANGAYVVIIMTGLCFGGGVHHILLRRILIGRSRSPHARHNGNPDVPERILNLLHPLTPSEMDALRPR